MTGLKNLLAMQKAKQQGIKANEVSADSSDVQPTDSQRGDVAVNTDSSESGSVSLPGADKDGGTAIPETTAGTDAKPKSLLAGKLNLLARPGVSGTSSRANSSGDGSAGIRKSDPATIAGGGDGPVEFSLDDIAGLDESASPAIESRDRDGSGFLNEIEATAPDRDLPADLESQQLRFVESLDGIYQVLNDPEMFGQSVRVIMMELQENPEYIKLIADQDVHTMIRGMRNTMGLARVKKQEKSRKTGQASRAKKSQVNDAAMNMLDGLLGGSDDDE